MAQPEPLQAISTPRHGKAASSTGLETRRWYLKRHCSLKPTQLGWMYVSLCCLSMGIAAFFWSIGATMVMPFAWLELVAVGAAFLLYARHATDAEKITIQGEQVLVEQETAGRTRLAVFQRAWVRIEPSQGDGSLIRLSAQGQCLHVGRHVRPELRPALARELRQALRGV